MERTRPGKLDSLSNRRRQLMVVAISVLLAAAVADECFGTSNFGGRWDCPGRGNLDLVQQGTSVTGTFSWNGGGRMWGQVRGNTFYWNGRENRGVESTGTMTLSPDGSRFSGTWQIPNGAGGDWGCSRAVTPPPPNPYPPPGGIFGGRWECPGRGILELVQKGTQVTGTFTWNGGGRVWGEVRGNTVYWNGRENRGVESTGTMTLSPDGSRFDGTWQIPNGPNGTWSCTRARGSGQRGPGGCQVTGVTCPGPGGVGHCSSPGTLAVMDEWLDRATPPMRPGESLCYDCWGRVLGTTLTGTITTAQNPDTGGKTRCEWLYYLAPSLQSGNGFGTLADSLRARGIPR